jgi:hypothetical protein
MERSPRTIFPKNVYPPGSRELPTTPTVVTTKDAYLLSAWLSNASGADRTVTFTDGNGVDVFPAVEMIAAQAVLIEPEIGLFFPGGFTWSASGDDVFCDLTLVTRP